MAEGPVGPKIANAYAPIARNRLEHSQHLPLQLTKRLSRFPPGFYLSQVEIVIPARMRRESLGSSYFTRAGSRAAFTGKLEFREESRNPSAGRGFECSTLMCDCRIKMVWQVFSAASRNTGQGLLSQDGIGPHLRMLKWRDRRGNPALIRHPHYRKTPGLAAAEGFCLLCKQRGQPRAPLEAQPPDLQSFWDFWEVMSLCTRGV